MRHQIEYQEEGSFPVDCEIAIYKHKFVVAHKFRFNFVFSLKLDSLYEAQNY